MKHLARGLWITLLLLTSVILGPVVDPSAYSKSQNQTAPNIFRRYDKSKRETITETGTMEILSGHFELNVSYTSPGQSPAKPERVIINFLAYYPDHEHYRDLIVRADGEELRLGTMQYRKLVDGNFTPREELTLSIPIELFIKVASAGKVEMSLGPTDFTLEAQHRRKLNGLLNSMPQ